jgi:hypothetical protein
MKPAGEGKGDGAAEGQSHLLPDKDDLSHSHSD